MTTITDSLHRFDAKQSEDPAKTDLELTCGDCGAVVCDIEADDNLKVLVQCADDHVCDPHDEDGNRITPEWHGLTGMQRERYDALMESVGDHDAALADAQQWPAASEDEPRIVDEKFNWMADGRPPLISGTGELQQVYSDEELGLTDPRDVANAESNRILAERKAQEGN